MKSHCTTSASAELLPPKHLTSHCSPSRSASEESPARGPTDVERSSICYQKHKSLPATSFLSPISQLLSKSSEHLCDAQGQGQGQAQTQTQTQAQAKPESAPAAAPTQSAPTPSNGPKRITFSGSLTPTNLSPDHSAQVKRGGSGKRGGGGGGGGGGGTLLKRMSGSIRRSQSANAHKDLPSVAQKLRERAEAFRAAAAQLDGERERIEEEGEAPTFDDETTATAAELYSTLNEKNKKRSTITGVIQNLIFLRKTTPESVETRLDKLLKQQSCHSTRCCYGADR